MSEAIKHQRALLDYIEYFEKLSRRSVPLLEKVAASNIYFKDPFNAVHGIEAMQKIFLHMYETVESPRFKVSDYAWGKNGVTAYLRWSMCYSVKGNKQRIEGMSEVMFDKDGKAISHIDHWDAGEGLYEKIPVLGAVIRFVKSKLAV